MRSFAFLVLCGSLAAVALTSPLLLKKDCARGPEVWCQNFQTASDCNAVKHCQQTVWNKPTVNSLTCDLCKEFVNVVGKFLKKNETEEEINEYLIKICEFLPEQDLVDQCKNIVDSYLPNILVMIKEELDNPQVVCSSLTLCRSLQKHLAGGKLQKQLQSNKISELGFSEITSPFIANVPLLLYPQDKPHQETQKTGNNVCKDCIQLVTDVQEAVKTNSSFVSSLIEHFKEECDRLDPVMVDTCKTYISQYSDLAVEMIMRMQEQQPQDVCNMVGFCSLKFVPLQTLLPAKMVPPVQKKPAEIIPSVTETFSLCEVCTLMVEEVESLLEGNKTEEEMVEGMEKACLLLPKKNRDRCQDFIEVYGKDIIDMLLEATNPKMVCVMLRCCSNNILPDDEIVPQQSQAGDLCDVCKMIVAYADKELAKNATTAEIEVFLERVCHYFPESVSEQCIQFVKDYEPTVVQLLAEMMDPSFVCSKLGVCAASKNTPQLESDLCVHGPSYWCKNMETASQCNAVEHCKRHVWN